MGTTQREEGEKRGRGKRQGRDSQDLAGMGDRLLLGASRLATCSSVNFFSSLSPPRFSPAFDMIRGRKWGFRLEGVFGLVCLQAKIGLR